MSTPHHTIKVVDGDFMLPREAVCVLLGIESQTLSHWMKPGSDIPYDPEARGFPARALGNWIRKRQTLRKSVGGRMPWLPDGVVIAEPKSAGGLPSAAPTPTPKADFNAEKTRKEKAQADKIEMENSVTRGELVPAADVEKGWADILSRVKTRMMQVPYSCAMIIAGETDMSKIQDVMREHVRDALLELSGDWRDSDEDTDDD